MILELTKDNLIKLVKGSKPKSNLMGEYSKLEYGNYIGGFVDEWTWYEWVLEELSEEELYKIFKECGELESYEQSKSK